MKYTIDDKHDILEFAAHMIMIGKLAERMGFNLENLTDDLKNGGYYDDLYELRDIENYKEYNIQLLINNVINNYFKKDGEE